jgi:hypothetical protein
MTDFGDPDAGDTAAETFTLRPANVMLVTETK